MPLTLRSSFRSRRLSSAVASVALLGLGAAVVWVSSVRLPEGMTPQRTSWEFRELATPSWRPLTEARVVRMSDGVLLIPGRGLVTVSSGPIDLDVEDYRDLRVHLKVDEPSEGSFHLRIQTSERARVVSQGFRTRGGSVFEEVVVDLSPLWGSSTRIEEILLSPSTTSQPVVLREIALDRAGGILTRGVEDLLSPFPGVAMASRAFTINTVAPPLVARRSVWVWLIPTLVVLAAAGVLLGHLSGGLSRVLLRVTLACCGAVWLTGFGLLLYHQLVALRTDLAKFPFTLRHLDDAYTLIDGVPLHRDIQEALRYIPPGSGVEFAVDRDDATGVKWSGRARYYLYPVSAVGATFRIRYIGASHAPCAEIDSDRMVVHDAERFCLVRL